LKITRQELCVINAGPQMARMLTEYLAKPSYFYLTII